jgi:hypothetical protein
METEFSFYNELQKKKSNSFKQSQKERFLNYLKWLYMQYLLFTALYVLEPFERRIFNMVVVICLLTSLYSMYVFLPIQIHHVINFVKKAYD